MKIEQSVRLVFGSTVMHGFLSFNFRFHVRPKFIDRTAVESSHVDSFTLGSFDSASRD